MSVNRSILLCLSFTYPVFFTLHPISLLAMLLNYVDNDDDGVDEDKKNNNYDDNHGDDIKINTILTLGWRSPPPPASDLRPQ